MARLSRKALALGAVGAALAALLALGWVARGRFQPIEAGSPAPDFGATDLGGRPVRLAELRGQVVLLNLWATWCPPCRDEMPSLQRLHQRYADRGLRVVAVSVDAEPGRRDASGNPGGDVAGFVREYGLTFDVWRDPSGRVQQLYRTIGLPETFVIGRDGRVVTRVLGAAEWDRGAHAELIRQLLGG